MNTSDAIASASLLVAFVALLVAWYAIGRANKTTSAATLVALNEGFRNGWVRYVSANEELKTPELAELLNLLEIACALFQEGSVSGNSAGLLREYLNGALRILAADVATSARIGALLQDTSTFSFIRRFLKLNHSVPHVTIPIAWYQE